VHGTADEGKSAAIRVPLLGSSKSRLGLKFEGDEFCCVLRGEYGKCPVFRQDPGSAILSGDVTYAAAAAVVVADVTATGNATAVERTATSTPVRWAARSSRT
jgi:hypothetical protein